MTSRDDQETQPAPSSPDATRRRLIKGGSALPLIVTLAPSANLAAQSAINCVPDDWDDGDVEDENLSASCLTSVNEAMARRGGPKFGSYT